MTGENQGPQDVNESTAAPTPEPAAAPAVPAQPGVIDHERFFLIGIIDGLMGLVRKVLCENLVMQSCRWAALIGMWATIVFAGLVVLFGLINAISAKSFGPFGVSLGMALLALALLYTAAKFCNAGRAIIDATESEMSSKAFLDSLALLSAVLAVVLIVGGIVTGIRMGHMMPVGVGFAFGAWWAYLTAVALNPSLVNVTVQSRASAGQEFLGIVSFFLKAKLRIVPIVYGIAVTVCTALFVVGMIRYLAADEWDKQAIALEMAELGGLILTATALPFIVYILVLLAYLLIDLARAILRIK